MNVTESKNKNTTQNNRKKGRYVHSDFQGRDWFIPHHLVWDGTKDEKSTTCFAATFSTSKQNPRLTITPLVGWLPSVLIEKGSVTKMFS